MNKTRNKVGRFYRGEWKQWQSDLYKFTPDHGGIGDLITNSMKEIIRTQDRSEWAYDCLTECFDLLIAGKRWADDIDDEIPDDRECKNRIDSWLFKMKFKFLNSINKKRRAKGKKKIQFTCKYRAQTDITRDSYISSFAAAVDMNVLQLIYTVSIPFKLYRGTTWKWHKYLKEPTDLNYAKWIIAENRASWFKVKGFVTELITLRRDAAEKRRMDLIKNK